MIKADTTLSHWSYMADPALAFLPEDRTFTVTPYRRGLWLTIKHNETGYDLIGRVVVSGNSKFAASLAAHLEGRFGGKVAVATVVVRHRFLPETEGRKGLHKAINSDLGKVDWSYYDFDIYDVMGQDVTNWPVMTYEVIANSYELNDLYQAINLNDELATGLLLCEEKDGEQNWFRRPFQYRMVGTFTRIDQQGNLFVDWTSPDGITYSGFFRKGEKSIVNELLDKYGREVIGKKALVTFQSKALLKPGRYRLYNVRFERLWDEDEQISNQLGLIG